MLVSVHYLDVVTFLGKWWDFSSNRFTWWFLVSLLGTYWWFTTGLMGAWVGWRPHEVGGRAGGSDERRRPNGGVGGPGPPEMFWCTKHLRNILVGVPPKLQLELT